MLVFSWLNHCLPWHCWHSSWCEEKSQIPLSQSDLIFTCVHISFKTPMIKIHVKIWHLVNWTSFYMIVLVDKESSKIVQGERWLNIGIQPLIPVSLPFIDREILVPLPFKDTDLARFLRKVHQNNGQTNSTVDTCHIKQDLKDTNFHRSITPHKYIFFHWVIYAGIPISSLSFEVMTRHMWRRRQICYELELSK